MCYYYSLAKKLAIVCLKCKLINIRVCGLNSCIKAILIVPSIFVCVLYISVNFGRHFCFSLSLYLMMKMLNSLSHILVI